jgi:hypothetical protein
MKKIIILATAMLLIISASAERRTIKDRTDNWLSREKAEATTPSEEETESGNLRIGPVPDPPTVPFGEGWYPLLTLMLAYSVYLFRRNKTVKTIK